jgi:hypothetical protein
MSIAPGGGLSIAPDGGQSVAPDGGLSIAPGGGLAFDRDWSRGLDTRTMRDPSIPSTEESPDTEIPLMDDSSDDDSSDDE